MAWLYEMFRFRLRLIRFALTMKRVAGASPDGDDDAADDAADDGGSDDDDKSRADATDDKADDGDADDDADDSKSDKSADDYRKQMRLNERRAKRTIERERAKYAELEAKLKERDDADKTDQEKAIDEARKEAEQSVTSKFETERRQDRLEVQVTRLATKGVKVGEGDKAKTQRFADPEDALVHLQRRITAGDLDEADIFDDVGKVKVDGLRTALTELLDDKPHLAVRENSANGHEDKLDPGDADAGKGSGTAGTLDEMSVEDHLAAIRKGPPKVASK